MHDKLGGLGEFEAKISLLRGLPYGIQHVLTMFVSNLTPIMLICAAANFSDVETTVLIQNAMLVAGIGTFVQLYGIWHIGARMPIVMGISTAFVALLSTIIAAHGYGVAVGAIIVGGIIEGLLGLCARYWTKFITPVVAGVVVATIGFNLLPVGARSFAGGNGAADFAGWQNILLGTVTLVVSIGWQALSPKKWKPLGILAGMVCGYILAIFIGKVDFSVFRGISVVALPKVFPYMPEFDLGAIFSVTLLYIVSATDTIGDTAAIANVAYGREATEEEMRGSIAADGLLSSLAGVFGCLPVDSFGQNIGLVSLTGVLNRRAIATGAGLLVLAGFVPAVAAVFTSVPQAVLGGCTITMFGSILVSGLQMIAESGFTHRNLTIAAASLSIGIGFTQVGMFDSAPALVQSLLGGNCVALSFIVALVLNIVLPGDVERDPAEEKEGGKPPAAPAE